jgi:hypothetical protein
MHERKCVEGRGSLRRRNMCSVEDNIEMVLKKLYGIVWCILDAFMWFEVESSGISCERGNELTVSVKLLEFVAELRDWAYTFQSVA